MLPECNGCNEQYSKIVSDLLDSAMSSWLNLTAAAKQNDNCTVCV